jgi:hypothetical protein
MASARAQAVEQGKRVEVTGKRTEDSTTWVNPNGALTTEVFQEPIRVRQDGTWKPVDTTLADTGAAVTPGATVADLNLSDGGTGPFAKVADNGTSLEATFRRRPWTGTRRRTPERSPAVTWW